MSENKKEISDKELENANGGMKIIVIQNNKKFIDYFKKMIEIVKKKKKED